LLERLSDALYHARSELVDGRDVSQKKYRNRLWAYVKQQLPSDTDSAVILNSLTDVGNRIDALDAAANKGLHSMTTVAATHRLLVNLTMLTFDLLALNGIDAPASSAYEREQIDAMRAMLLSSRQRRRNPPPSEK
jgi:hypothetical protein